jgi:hypothetical protein
MYFKFSCRTNIYAFFWNTLKQACDEGKTEQVSITIKNMAKLINSKWLPYNIKIVSKYEIMLDLIG